MNKKIFYAFSVCISLLLGQMFIANPVLACSCATSHHQAKAAGCICHKENLSQLSLSATQKTKIDAICKQAYATKSAEHKQLKAVNSELRALVKTDKLDENKLNTLIGQKKEIVGTMLRNKVVMKHEIYSVLTAEQKVKFDAMMEARKKQMEN